MKEYSTNRFSGMSSTELNAWAKDFYRRGLQGRKVKNRDKGVTIEFSSLGRNKAASYKMNGAKAAVLADLVHVMQDAKFSSFGVPKIKHVAKYRAVGFLNFIYRCKVDGVRRNFRLPVMITPNGKFHYALDQFRV